MRLASRRREPSRPARPPTAVSPSFQLRMAAAPKPGPQTAPPDGLGSGPGLAAGSLANFADVARAAPRVWAWVEPASGVLRVSGRPPASGAATDTAAVLTHQLVLAHGMACLPGVAESLRLTLRRDGSLPASAVLRALEDAEAVAALLRGVDDGVRLQFSATARGTGFLRCCEELGLDATALPEARCEDIDRRFTAAWNSRPPGPPHEAAARECLLAVLQQPLH
jgi:hypothetical protein